MSLTVYSDEYEYHIKLKKGDVGKYVILPGDPGRCEEIASYLDDARLIASNREYTTYTGYLNGEKVSVTSTGIGGPSAAIALGELISIGADTFIRVGTSGGMDEKVKPGDIVVASSAIRQEGTSREYAPLEFPATADFLLTHALYETAKASGVDVHVGVVQSKDSFYGQHSPDSMPVSYELKNKWDAWIKCGALASEMECAALFMVGNIRKVKVGAVLTVMGNSTRRDKGIKEEVCYSSKNAIEVAVNTIKRLIDVDKCK